MLSARLDVPSPPLDVSPYVLPRRLPAAVRGLELAGLDHPEAPARLRDEGGDEVAGFGHAVYGSRVDVQAPASIRRPPVLAARLPLVTDWPEGWRPANPAEAQEYVDAHAGGGGDAETLEHCNWVFERSTKPPRPPTPEPGHGKRKPSPYSET